MYDVRVSCYVRSMSRIIFIRRNEHDFLVLGLRNNGLKVVKGGLDLLTNFSPVLPPLYACLITKSDTETERSEHARAGYEKVPGRDAQVCRRREKEHRYYTFVIR